MSTPGKIAKFGPTGNVIDSIITETDGGSIGIATPTPGVRTQLEGTSDPEATLAIRRSDNNKFVRLGAGSIGVALDFDPTSVLVIQKNTSGVGGHLDGPELLRITPDGRIGIGTPNPDRPLTVQAQDAGQELISFKDPGGATKWHINQDLGGSNPGLNFVETGVADGRLFLKAGGNVGIGTSDPVTALHLAGNLTLDAGDSPVLFTGTGNSEENRYLQLINSPGFTSASGLKAGGILIADGYSFGNPGKNDLIVKGNVGIGTANPVAKLVVIGSIATPHATLGETAAGGGGLTLTQQNNIQTVSLTQDGAGGGLIRVFGAGGTQIGNETVDLGQNTADGGSLRLLGPNGNETVLISGVIGLPNNGFVGVTDAQGVHSARMTFDTSGNSVVMADIKNFRVAHPTQPGTDIVYACIEGPEAAVYVRGTGHLVNGEASIPLPDHFVSVANPETMTVQVTPLSADSLGLSVIAKGPIDFVVKELHRGAGSYDFDWEVKCVRKGHEGYAVTRPHEETASRNGLAPQAAMEMRTILTSPPQGRRSGETP